MGGHNRSRFAGGGQEFLDHRNFHHGDDLRAVNWRAYMRLEKMFLKMFQIEPRVPVRMLLDTSDSMTATAAQIRLRAPARRRALLRRPGAARHHRVHPFSNKPGTRCILCTAGGIASVRCWIALKRLEAGGPDGFPRRSCASSSATYPQRGLVIVISDFLDDQGCERALQYLADFGHELMLLQIWADEDRTPPWTGELELRGRRNRCPLKLQFDEPHARIHCAPSTNMPQPSRSGAAQRRRYAGSAQPLESVSSARWCACGDA